MSVDSKFNEDSKNVLKKMIRLLQVGFTGDFVPDCLVFNFQISMICKFVALN